MFTALSGVSSNDLQPSAGTGTLSNTPGATVPKQAPVPAPQTDTVKLSITQQVRNLHAEGEGPGQIASSLGLTSSDVNNELYVSLTWPQLLSKVASSTLTLGSTSSDASVSLDPVPSPATDANAAVIFPTGRSSSTGPATPGTKGASAAELVIFPTAKDTQATPAVDDSAAKSSSAPAVSSVAPGKDATAA